MSANRPSISLIVPTYSRPMQLAACLDTARHLEYPSDRLEIIVVDDGSPAEPAEANQAACHAARARYLAQSHSGPAAARNLGAAHARGEYLAFTDDDCLPAPNWLAALVGRLSAAPEAGVGGQTINALGGNPYSSASQALVDYIYSYYNTDPDHAHFFASNNLVLPAETFHSLGGFENNLASASAEDRELCDRWIFHNQRLIYEPSAVVYHAHQLEWGSFWRQHFTYGRGAFFFRRAYARRRCAPVRIEPPGFYFNLVQHVGRQAPTRGREWQAESLAVISQVANLAGFARQRLAPEAGAAQKISQALTRLGS